MQRLCKNSKDQQEYQSASTEVRWVIISSVWSRYGAACAPKSTPKIPEAPTNTQDAPRSTKEHPWSTTGASNHPPRNIQKHPSPLKLNRPLLFQGHKMMLKFIQPPGRTIFHGLRPVWPKRVEVLEVRCPPLFVSRYFSTPDQRVEGSENQLGNNNALHWRSFKQMGPTSDAQIARSVVFSLIVEDS